MVVLGADPKVLLKDQCPSMPSKTLSYLCWEGKVLKGSCHFLSHQYVLPTGLSYTPVLISCQQLACKRKYFASKITITLESQQLLNQRSYWCKNGEFCKNGRENSLLQNCKIPQYENEMLILQWCLLYVLRTQLFYDEKQFKTLQDIT